MTLLDSDELHKQISLPFLKHESNCMMNKSAISWFTYGAMLRYLFFLYSCYKSPLLKCAFSFGMEFNPDLIFLLHPMNPRDATFFSWARYRVLESSEL